MNNFLSKLPWIDVMSKEINGTSVPRFRLANGHIHSPWSFSAFETIDTAFGMAKKENISVLGINDFFVADGYDEFAEGCLKNNIFPLFNIEFIGLLKDEQKKGIRINDPNNPGRIYFSGKGLDYPFSPGWINSLFLKRLIGESQVQMKEMITKLNSLISDAEPTLSMSYEGVKRRYARQLVRERHLAKALWEIARENFKSPEEQIGFIEKISGKKYKSPVTNNASIENEIRSNLLKSGGPAFVEEKEGSFPELTKLKKIIIRAGGIPCYPVLLDDASGNYTEFEADPERLYHSLKKYGIGCIELIPGRNDFDRLKEFTLFFNKRDFTILFGTEHNTPDLIPLTVTARKGVPLDDQLNTIAWEGVCIVAAHQYLRAHGRQGYVLPNGTTSHKQKEELSGLGKLVIEYFLKKNQNGSAN